MLQMRAEKLRSWPWSVTTAKNIGGQLQHGQLLSGATADCFVPEQRAAKAALCVTRV